MGFRGSTLSWLTSFLCNRSMYTAIGEVSSSACLINYGVPQGSVLGPLLFLVYVNDICNCVDDKIRLFADDANVFVVNKCIFSLFRQANSVLSKLNVWAIGNK